MWQLSLFKKIIYCATRILEFHSAVFLAIQCFRWDQTSNILGFAVGVGGDTLWEIGIVPQTNIVRFIIFLKLSKAGSGAAVVSITIHSPCTPSPAVPYHDVAHKGWFREGRRLLLLRQVRQDNCLRDFTKWSFFCNVRHIQLQKTAIGLQRVIRIAEISREKRCGKLSIVQI